MHEVGDATAMGGYAPWMFMCDDCARSLKPHMVYVIVYADVDVLAGAFEAGPGISPGTAFGEFEVHIKTS